MCYEITKRRILENGENVCTAYCVCAHTDVQSRYRFELAENLYTIIIMYFTIIRVFISYVRFYENSYKIISLFCIFVL